MEAGGGGGGKGVGGEGKTLEIGSSSSSSLLLLRRRRFFLLPHLISILLVFPWLSRKTTTPPTPSPPRRNFFSPPDSLLPFPPLSPLHFSSNASPYSYRSLGRRRRGEKLFGTSSRDFAACEYHSFFKRFSPFFSGRLWDH